jgi:hypothetical protein
VQAAGLAHPNEIRATHIVRRGGDNEVRLLANQLAFVKPGELLLAAAGGASWPHRVFQLYWPKADPDNFAPLP